MLKIRIKDERGEKEREVDASLVKELREVLPAIFSQVSDDDLYLAYHTWSQDNWCAGWLMVDEDTISDFTDAIELLDANGTVVPFDEN